mgnify:CR=1 FL=1
MRRTKRPSFDHNTATSSAIPVTICSPSAENAARQTMLMMERVVLEGTGRRAKLDGYSSGGKTGSAQIYAYPKCEGGRVVAEVADRVETAVLGQSAHIAPHVGEALGALPQEGERALRRFELHLLADLVHVESKPQLLCSGRISHSESLLA